MSKKLLAIMFSVIMAVAAFAVPATSAGLLDIFSDVTAANSQAQDGQAPSAETVNANVETESNAQ